jgi:hypothetical protein
VEILDLNSRKKLAEIQHVRFIFPQNAYCFNKVHKSGDEKISLTFFLLPFRFS